MNFKKFSKRERILLLFIIFAAIIRLMPHPPNFAPITAMALFGGLNFQNKKLAYSIPLLAMIISDLFLVFYFLLKIILLNRLNLFKITFVFYNILYLCALEVLPYLVLFKLIH